MISNKIPTAASAVRFGMPVDGYAFGTTRGTTGAFMATCAPVATPVRDRQVAGVQKLAIGSFPGTSAWRPPTC
jgi:hypothetical protein